MNRAILYLQQKSRSLSLFVRFLLIIMSASVIACGGNDSGDDSSPAPDDLDVDPTVAGYDEIGSGYDVFTAYADVEYIKNQILDLDALNRDGKVSKFTADKFDLIEHKGTTINEYAESYRVSIGVGGSYNFFSAEVNSVFSRMSNVSTQWSFATLQINHLVHGLAIDRMQSETLKEYLLNQAITDIDTMPLPDLFEMYGTHVIGRLLVGGRIDYNFTALIEEKEQKDKIGVYAKARLNYGFSSIKVSTDIEWESFQRDYVSEEDFNLSSVGGHGSALKTWTDNDYEQWVETVWTNPVFCDFSADPWLVPVYELATGWNSSTSVCSPDSRCEEIRNAYIKYANKHKYMIFPPVLMVKNSFDADNDHEGWSYDGAGGFNWKDGNSKYSEKPFGAHLEAIEGNKSPWYFKNSSESYSGDMSHFYGGELTYRFRWRAADESRCRLRGRYSQYDRDYGSWWMPDVQIKGANGTIIGYFFEFPPDTYIIPNELPDPNDTCDEYSDFEKLNRFKAVFHNCWRPYSVPIIEDFGVSEDFDVKEDYKFGWIKYCENRPGCYIAASRDEILSVLKDVEFISIRGEYCFGTEAGDRGMLDEVILKAADTDDDTIFDIKDNCPNTYNPNQEDDDGDGIGDACDT